MSALPASVRRQRRTHVGSVLVIGALALLAISWPASARAQCGANRSTCSGCHDGARAPYGAAASWHLDHCFADVCAVCHGGAPEATAPALAHAGMVAPLANEGEQCRSCHGAASAALASRYAAGIDSAAAARDAGAPGGDALPPTTPTTPTTPAPGANDAFAGLIAGLIAVAGLAWIVVRERRASLRWREWSPYLGGVALGLVVAVSMGIFGHRLSGAGAYQHLSGYVGRLLAPHSMYWAHVVPTGITWDVQVALGAVAGAFVSSRLAGTFRVRTMPDSGWREVFGDSVALRWAVAFFGSMLTEIGGGISGGCTASLAVSGGAMLVPGAFLFMVGMFAGGIPALALVRRGRSP